MSGDKATEIPPGSVLFVCNLNAVRSPMAEALAKAICGKRIYFDSAGLEPRERDPFVLEVMNEIGVDMSEDHPQNVEEISVGSFDLVICLTYEARNRVAELTRGEAVEVEFWPTIDPFAHGEEGTRDQRLHAYRELREELRHMIANRFSAPEKGSASGGRR